MFEKEIGDCGDATCDAYDVFFNGGGYCVSRPLH